MKWISLIYLLFLSTTQAQIFADFETTAGNFTVRLHDDKAPKAVANFIGLATGSRPWIDSNTGKIRTDPFFNGLTFHRTAQGFVNQFGSRNGTNSSPNPGYTFSDEFDPSLDFSTPYQFAMANSGPNSNGSQIFVTVGTPTFLNNVHTIFGTIPDDGTSRETIDAINNAPTLPSPNDETPVNPVTINKISIRRVGTSAENFDELAQNLPIPINIHTQLTSPATLTTSLQNNTTLQVYSSTNLAEWNFLGSIYYDGNDALPPSIGLPAPTPTIQSRFYRPTLTVYPNPPYIPTTLTAGTVIEISTSLGFTTYTFTALGSGSFDHSFPDQSTASGTFTARIENVTPISALLTLFPDIQDENNNDVAIQTTISRYDSPSPTQLTGEHKGDLFTLNPDNDRFEQTRPERDTFSLSQ